MSDEILASVYIITLNEEKKYSGRSRQRQKFQ
jgi:hypothetical protein